MAVLVAVSAIAVAGVSVASGSSDRPGAATAGEWALSGADQQNTLNVPGPITSANVTKLKKDWSVPIRATGSFGTYATTPVVINGAVYTQDINSNVYSIDLKSGKVHWFKKYNSPSVGPNGVNVVGGVVYGATGDSAFALQPSTGEQLWVKKLTRHENEGIDMAPGFNNGTVYISTVPGNAKGFYQGNGQAILWALNAKSGAVQWKWEEVPKDIWSKAHTNINSGGGQWDPPSFDSNGDLYLGVSNPAPWPGAKGLPFGSSRPGPNVYTDSIVKLDHATGKLMWQVFTANCGGCHTLADAGSTGSVGPNLDDLAPDIATVVHQVTNGGGAMPAFGGRLSDAQIQSVAKYVSSVAGSGGGGGVGGTP